MDPRAVVHPVGPLPPRVYWLRRVATLAVLAVVVAIIAVSCSGGSSGGGTPSARSSTTPTPTASRTTSAVGTCGAGQLTVTASTDADHYPTGSLPHFTVTIRNTGTQPCRFVDAATTRVWSVLSGTDEVWTDAGCTSSGSVTRVLAAKAAVRHAVIWNRQRSGPHCTSTSTSAAPGTYRLYVTVRGERSAAAIFHLTG